VTRAEPEAHSPKGMPTVRPIPSTLRPVFKSQGASCDGRALRRAVVGPPLCTTPRRRTQKRGRLRRGLVGGRHSRLEGFRLFTKARSKRVSADSASRARIEKRTLDKQKRRQECQRSVVTDWTRTTRSSVSGKREDVSLTRFTRSSQTGKSLLARLAEAALGAVKRLRSPVSNALPPKVAR